LILGNCKYKLNSLTNKNKMSDNYLQESDPSFLTIEWDKIPISGSIKVKDTIRYLHTSGDYVIELNNPDNKNKIWFGSKDALVYFVKYYYCTDSSHCYKNVCISQIKISFCDVMYTTICPDTELSTRFDEATEAEDADEEKISKLFEELRENLSKKFLEVFNKYIEMMDKSRLKANESKN
jgi:hypothetical protein